MPRFVQSLLALSSDRDTKTSIDCKSLVIAVCDFEFIFCLLLPKVIFSNMDSLWKVSAGTNADVIIAKIADSTITALGNCRNEESFKTCLVGS